jgi:DNA/RNA endonuclease YhcR with UshA esterase domain
MILKLHLRLILSIIFCQVSFLLYAQVTLTSSPYTENFDSIGQGLPTGWTLRTGATASSPGNISSTFNKNTIGWNSTAGAFKNFASGDIGSAAASDTSATGVQKTATDRALGIRQTSAFGDNGSAFVLQLANTSGKTGLVLKFKLQSLDANSPRVATWKIDYAIGASPTSFTSDSQSFTTGGSKFSNTDVTVNFGASLDNQTEPIWIRIVTLSATSGSGNRPSTAIDDVSLEFNSNGTPSPNLVISGSLNPFITSPGTPSSEQNYTISGTNLVSDVTITAPSDFEIRTSSSSFTNSVTLPQTSGTVASTQIFVRFNPVSSGTKAGNITHVSGSESKSLSVSGSNPGALLTIAQARATSLGSLVNVGGRVTVAKQFGTNEITFQDATGGMSVYISDDASELAGLTMGDSITVSGKTSEFQATTGQAGTGNFQISGTATEVTVTKIGNSSRIITPKTITLSQFAENLEGQLVTINNATFTETGNFKAETNYTISDASAINKQLRTDVDTDLFGDNISTIPQGQISITGIITQFRGTYQIKPRSRADIPDSKLVTYINTVNDATSKNQTLDIGTWNLEWFGDASNGPTDNNLQAQNAAKVLAELDLDLVGVEEIVDINLFRNMLVQLNALKPGNNYKGFLTPLAQSQTQKVGFIFKGSVIDSVNSKFSIAPVTVSSSSWAYNGSVSRPPYEFEFDFKYGNNQKKRLKAIVLHGNAGNTDQPKRLADYQELKTYMDNQLSNVPVVAIGDWNDMIKGSIDGSNIESPMKNFVTDSTHYKFLTAPLHDLGLSSQTLGSLIDHILISDELFPYYLNGTTRVASVSFIPGYYSTTSDHTPVWTRLLFPDCSLLTQPVISLSGDKIVSTNLTLTSSSVQGNQWLKNGVEIPGATQQTYSVNAPGSYAVRVTLNGCSATSNSEVIAASEHFSSDQISIFPNPTHGNIKITHLINQHNYEVYLMNSQGIIIAHYDGNEELINTQLSKKLSTSESGLYFIKINNTLLKVIKD